jgi:hypothetical protein
VELVDEETVFVENIVLTTDTAVINSRMDSIFLQADIFPDTASQQTVLWQLTDGSDIASITQDGWLIANGEGNGTATVRVSAIDGSGVYQDIEVEISNQLLAESINVTASAGLIDTVGGSIQFYATILPEGIFNNELIWEIISGEAIAEITQDGLLTANGTGDGDVTIRVSTTDGSEVYREITIPVTNQLTSVQSLHKRVRVWSSGIIIHYILPDVYEGERILLYSLQGKHLQSEILQQGSGSFRVRTGTSGLYVVLVETKTEIKSFVVPIYE